MRTDAHSWIFPVVAAVGTCASAFQAFTGVRLGFGWPNDPTYIRLFGSIGVLVGIALLVFWFVARGPSPS